MKKMTVDGNTAVTLVAYAFSELAAIYPITPASPMAELADKMAAEGKVNLFGQVPKIIQLQSEGGAAGTLHGALTCGALSTSFTCSQGLLLMLPNLYKIAGEQLPTVIHVSARALSTHALSIFGDHQDVMACRQCGFAMLASSSVQEAMDFALISHLATLKSSVPFLHFFDGFRTSHEYAKIDAWEHEDIRPLLCEEDILKFRTRALSPDIPIARGTAQNPDVYFQNRERANAAYLALPNTVQTLMDSVAKITKRSYRVFDYCGAKDANCVVVIMGSGASTMEETVEKLVVNGEKVGLIKVRLYRPFDDKRFIAALPKSCKKIAVLDRTKEAGALGEPLYLDVCAALNKAELSHIQVLGGRYGLGGKEFTPRMCRAVFDNLRTDTPKNPFTVGICDDSTHLSLALPDFSLSQSDCVACKFYGLGSDGTVGANKNSARIIGENTELFVQAYFCYDSRKSGGITLSHLRFSKTPIRAAYLIDEPSFVACHDPSYINRLDMLDGIMRGGTFLLNCPWTDLNELNAYLPPAFKKEVAKKELRFFIIDATKIANRVGLKGRTSTVMQAAFFYLHSHLLPYEKAICLLKEQIQNTFKNKGEDVIRRNFAALDETAVALQEIHYPKTWATATDGASPRPLPDDEYFREFMHPILSLHGNDLPVSAFQADGAMPTGTSRLETHGTAFSIPVWISENCIECNQCAFVCPHACIRPFLLDKDASTPQGMSTKAAVGLPDKQFRIQVVPLQCTGCGVCANTCPTKEKALVMRPAQDLRENEEKNWEFLQALPPAQPPKNAGAFKRDSVKGSQFYPPLFEFSYACAGCGETPYLKILTQLFGERLLIANATGCSSIYGGSTPSCPYAKNADGKGPSWASSLFEDNAEFGLGMRLAWAIQEGRNTNKSVWIIGGDGWAYDIGYGGLDHVLASGENVNVLVLDSEVYSNTGGQASKATPMGATARFAANGKSAAKKDLGLMAMSYQNVYVAQVCIGANKQQYLNTLREAEAYDGPSLIIAYSPCIAHGFSLSNCMDEQKLAVDCGYWLLYRFRPDLKAQGENPFILDSKQPTLPLREFLLRENRFVALQKSNPERAELLFTKAEKECKEKREFYERLSSLFEP